MKQLIILFILCASVLSADAQLRKPSTGGVGGVGDTTFKWKVNGGSSLKDSIRFSPGTGILQSTAGNSVVTVFDSTQAVVGSTAIPDGAIRTADFNPTAKAPNAVQADSAVPRGLATGDLSGGYPNPVVKTNAITSSKILDGTIIRGDVSSTFQAPFSDTSMGLSTTYWFFGSTTIIANTDSIHIVDSRITTNSKAQSLCVRGRYVTGYLGTVPIFIPYSGSYTIWFPREMPGVDINLDYILNF